MDIGTIIDGIGVADLLVTALVANTAVTESLPFVKKAKSNGTIQLFFNVIRAIAGAFNKKSK